VNRSKTARRARSSGKRLLGLVVSVVALAAASAGPAMAEDPFDLAARHNQAFARDRLAASTARLSTSAWPQLTGGDQRWVTTGASAWTSGFLPGALWLAYQDSPTSAWRSRAERWQAGLAGQASNTSTHDVGFMVFDSFGNGYRLTGTDSYRQTVLRAAASLASRYSPTVGCIRSWNSGASDFQVIVDNMMNLELLFWASKHGGQRAWYDMAVSHALKTAANHVRPDGSTYHLVVYNPTTGAVKSRRTVQGYADSSTWARGQAWAINGFTMTYRETGDARFLDTARRVADWFVAHLPADRIPYWDFDAPGIPLEPRDTSAAAIAASGLLELSTLEPDATRAQGYATTARAILAALSTPPYLSEGSGSEAVLLHGTANKPGGSFDTGLIYGDYFFLEAMLRLRRLAPAGDGLAVAGVTASSDDGNAPANAVDGDLATRWSAQGDGQWLRLDLGLPRVVTKVTVGLYRGDERAARFDLQASLDGTTWTTLAGELASGTTLRPETYDVPDTVARYVRYLGHGATGTTWNSVTEIALR
jgi:unsaturated chondroitin disaccharide hydrolase